MKTIALNTWGCRKVEPLFEYIKENKESTDIFCFQEVLKNGVGVTEKGEPKNGYEKLASLLSEYTGCFSEYGEMGYYYTKRKREVDFKFGIATFVKNTSPSSFKEEVYLCDYEKTYNDYDGKFAAGIAHAVSVRDYLVINIHGMWQGSIKTDTEAKLQQSKDVINLAERHKGKKVICGDFNLLPETDSIQMFRDNYKDLIRDFGITDTRGDLYTKELRYADYIFVDKDVHVESLLVPNIGVSDHLPLVIKFDNKEEGS